MTAGKDRSLLTNRSTRCSIYNILHLVERKEIVCEGDR